MEFFISGELDTLVADAWRPLRKAVEERINNFCRDRDYGESVKKIAVIPIILREDWKTGHEERRLFQRKQAAADYRTHIDFDAFQSGNDSVREELLVENILSAIMDIQRKAGAGFQGQRLADDIRLLFNPSAKSLSGSKAKLFVQADPASRRRPAASDSLPLSAAANRGGLTQVLGVVRW